MPDRELWSGSDLCIEYMLDRVTDCALLEIHDDLALEAQRLNCLRGSVCEVNDSKNTR